MMIVLYELLEDQTAEVIFTCCLLCGNALNCFEKHDGVCTACFEKAEEEPIPFKVTDQGRAHVACIKALEDLHDEAADIQEGGNRRLSRMLEAFREVTGNDFFHND
jgi:hypothetical protein